MESVQAYIMKPVSLNINGEQIIVDAVYKEEVLIPLSQVEISQHSDIGEAPAHGDITQGDDDEVQLHRQGDEAAGVPQQPLFQPWVNPHVGEGAGGEVQLHRQGDEAAGVPQQPLFQPRVNPHVGEELDEGMDVEAVPFFRPWVKTPPTTTAGKRRIECEGSSKRRRVDDGEVEVEEGLVRGRHRERATPVPGTIRPRTRNIWRMNKSIHLPPQPKLSVKRRSRCTTQPPTPPQPTPQQPTPLPQPTPPPQSTQPQPTAQGPAHLNQSGCGISTAFEDIIT